MKIIIAVLKDLYIFAFIYRFGFVSTSPSLKFGDPSLFATSAPKKETFPLESILDTKVEKKTNDLNTYPPKQNNVIFNNFGYINTPDTPMYSLPTRTFDGVIKKLPYGASFQIINKQGKWINILVGEIKGWIHYDNFTESSASLNPKFTKGEMFNDTHSSTVKLRTHINDSFHSRDFALPLQDVEYVSYRLLKKGINILWGNERPRLAGTWQQLLKGIPGVHISITPKTGAIMEYLNLDNTGHVVYVESVYPDKAISISEIGYPTEGIYNERTINNSEWKELQPIFIKIA